MYSAAKPNLETKMCDIVHFVRMSVIAISSLHDLPISFNQWIYSKVYEEFKL